LGLRGEPTPGRAAFPGALGKQRRGRGRPAMFAKIDQAFDNLHQLVIEGIV
jgi:hypothetical protein